MSCWKNHRAVWRKSALVDLSLHRSTLAFIQAALLENVPMKVPPPAVLHHQCQVLWQQQHLKQLHDVGV